MFLIAPWVPVCVIWCWIQPSKLNKVETINYWTNLQGIGNERLFQYQKVSTSFYVKLSWNSCHTRYSGCLLKTTDWSNLGFKVKFFKFSLVPGGNGFCCNRNCSFSNPCNAIKDYWFFTSLYPVWSWLNVSLEALPFLMVILASTYSVILTEFKVRTISYRPSFSYLFMAQAQSTWAIIQGKKEDWQGAATLARFVLMSHIFCMFSMIMKEPVEITWSI